MAQADIDEDKAKHEELLEQQAKSKKKPKKRKSKKKAVELWDKTPEEIYTNYYFLNSVTLQFCKIQPLQAPSLGKLFERAAPYLTNVNLRGNEFGAVGLGEIGAGLERCALKLEHIPIPGEKTILKQIYSGTK